MDRCYSLRQLGRRGVLVLLVVLLLACGSTETDEVVAGDGEPVELHFETAQVSLEAKSFTVSAGGSLFVPSGDVMVGGGRDVFNTSTALQLTWHQHDIEMAQDSRSYGEPQSSRPVAMPTG